MSCSAIFESLEPRLLLNGNPVINFDAVNPATFVDQSGDDVVVCLRGAGTGEVELNGPGQADAARITLFDTNAKSTLAITVKGLKTDTTVGDIEVKGHLKNLTAPKVHLTGNLTVEGGLGNKLALGDVDADHLNLIHVHTNPALAVNIGWWGLAVTLGNVTDCRFFAEDIPIRSFIAAGWEDTDAVQDQIVAPRIGWMTIHGDFEADLTLTDAPGRGPTLRSATIRGNMTDSNWDIEGDMGWLNIAGWATRSTVRTTGSMQSVRLDAAFESNFLAGIAPEVAAHASVVEDFVNPAASIRSAVVRGQRVPKGQQVPRFFIDSYFSAASVGRVSLVNVEFQQPQPSCGIFALETGEKREIRSVRYRDVENRQENWFWPGWGKQVFAPPNVDIEIINQNNHAPTADAGDDQMVGEGDNVQLDGSGSNDPDGQVLQYAWQQVGGPAAVIDNADAAVAEFVAPETTVTVDCTFQLTVTDPHGESHTDEIIVTVIHLNAAPDITDLSGRVQQAPGEDFAPVNRDPDNGDGVAAPLNVHEGRTVALNAVAEDLEGGVTYQWTQISGKDVGAISGADTADASFVAPVLVAGDTVTDATLIFEVTVTDDGGLTANGQVTVRLRLLGDVNHDDLVSSMPGGADWMEIIMNIAGDNLERYDLTDAGVIDANDIATAAANNGRQIAPP